MILDYKRTDLATLLDTFMPGGEHGIIDLSFSHASTTLTEPPAATR